MQRKQVQRKSNAAFLGLAVCLPLLFLALWIGMMKEEPAEAELTEIFLQQEDIHISGGGATVLGNTVTIGQGGCYRISGALKNGQIYVDCKDNGIVLLEFDGVELGNLSGAPIYIEHAENTTILLAPGTENYICSGMECVGIENTDTESDRMERTEKEFADAENAEKNREKQEKEVQRGAVIYAEQDLHITGEGSLHVIGQLNNGIQSKSALRIDGGNIVVETAGNAIKGKDSVTIEGGNFQIRAGKRGMQAKYELRITGGNIRIQESEEGLEANQILIEGGAIEINAKDDGINANGGEAKQKKNPSEDIVETMPNLIIKGGIIHIDAEGDGLDSNGNLLIEGGELVIDGPTKDDNGPLDYGKENDGVCRIKGGVVLAIGSSGMAETFDERSEQCSFRCLLQAPYEAGSEIVIVDADGQELYRHTTAKTGASVVFSSPVLMQGEVYALQVEEQTVEIRQDNVSTLQSER